MLAIDVKTVGLRTLARFLPMAILVIGATVIYGQSTKHRDFTVRSSRATTAVLVGKVSLADGLKSLVRNLHFLHRSFATNRLCDEPKPYQVRNFENFSKNFLMAQPDYDQVRWIGKDGMERVRLDRRKGRPALVPANKLQNKKKRYYFIETLSLKPGNLYISPLDLNKENGHIEHPYKPMLRIGAPVIDARGRKCGIILLNYLGKKLIHGFVQATDPLDSQTILLNQDGYYLISPHADKTWGFMFDRTDMTLAHHFPAAWQHISTEGRGQFLGVDGLWTFETVDIAKYLRAMGAIAPENSQDRWKIVSHLSRDELYAASNVKQERAWAVTLAMLTLLLFLSWRLAKAATMREKLERKIAVQAAEYEDLYNFAPFGYHSIDKNGIIIRINQTELDWLGYTRDELIGQPIWVIHVNQNKDLVAHKLADLNAHRPIQDMEFDLRRKDGSFFPVSLSVTPVYDDQDRFLFSRSMLFDLRYRRMLENELKKEAHSDPLTGLHNRRSFAKMAEHELSRCRRLGTSIALMLFDIDFFKKINDRYGHDVGDVVLKSCSRACSRAIREIDILARWGGEEFIALLPGIDASQAMEVAERLKQVLAADEVALPDGQHISYTVSIGVTSLFSDSDGIESMIKRADTALYAAKQAGRDRVIQG